MSRTPLYTFTFMSKLQNNQICLPTFQSFITSKRIQSSKSLVGNDLVGAKSNCDSLWRLRSNVDRNYVMIKMRKVL